MNCQSRPSTGSAKLVFCRPPNTACTESPATRRQLLEYLLAHEADGALLVDMDAEVVVHVEFPGLLGD